MSRSYAWQFRIGMCFVVALVLSTGPASAQPRSIAMPTVPAVRQGQAITLLPNGDRLVTGGESEQGGDARIAVRDRITNVESEVGTRMATGRAWHTATLLPDGRVLLYGGMSAYGQVVSAPELFDPVDGSVIAVDLPSLTPRAFHSATLMTDGRLLVTGGVTPGGAVAGEALVWDVRTGAVVPFKPTMDAPRYGHAATLLPSAPVLISGGLDQRDQPVTTLEQFDPERLRFDTLSGNDFTRATPFAHSPLPASVEASLPENGARDVDLASMIAVRFSRLVDVTTLNQDTVVLFGPNGRVAAKVVPTEGGLLLFVTPDIELLPGTQYTLFMDGALDASGGRASPAALTFVTRALTAAAQHDRSSASGAMRASYGATVTGGNAGGSRADSTVTTVADTHTATTPARSDEATPRAHAANDDDDPDEFWTPTDNHRTGDWHTGKGDGRGKVRGAPLAAAGITAVSGVVLLQNEKALKDVTVTIGKVSTTTNGQGEFLLTDVSPGLQEMQIDGTTANKGNKRYAKLVVNVDVQANQNNPLPYVVWLPRIRQAEVVTIPSPTTQEVIVTNPDIPGLELRIPAGAVIRDRDGKVITEISITPVPIDRTPFPLPMPIAVYFTIQPGMAYVESVEPGVVKGVQLVYPNYARAPAGTVADFYNYDPARDGWYVYGSGTVNKTGTQIVPDPGVAFYQFSGAMVASPAGPPPPVPTPPCGVAHGDPVLCRTGHFLHTQTDLSLDDVIPIAVTRTYRTGDVSDQRPFGYGANNDYSQYLYFPAPFTYSSVDLIRPDGSRIHYVRTSTGTGYEDAVFEHTTSPTSFYKSVITWSTTLNRWELALKNKSIYRFGYTQAAPLMSITDRYGNAVVLTRPTGVGYIDQITSPNGRYIKFGYDNGHVIWAVDSIGRRADYTYDASGRLIRATDPTGAHEDYTYDAAGRMLTVTDKRGNVMVTNVYDANGRVWQQTLADGGIYQFAYTTDASGNITQADVTNPRGFVRRVVFNSDGYAVSDAFPFGHALQQVTTHTRQAGSSLILSTTDALGRVTARTYDSQGNPASVTRLSGTPNAVTTSFTYEPNFNRLASMTDPLGHTTTFAYDGLGRLTTLTDALNHAATFTYNAAGQPITATNALGQTMSFSYVQGMLSSTTDPLSRMMSIVSDGAGRTVLERNAIGVDVRTDFDLMNRAVAVADPIAGIATLTYDGNGNLLALVDQRSGTNAYAYDARDRVVSRTDPLSRVESFAYDGMDNQTRWTDRKGQVTNYTYDALNRRTQTAYQDGSTTTYSYDAGNRLVQVVDSVSGTVTYTYDGLDRITSETTSAGTVAYTYDAAGRRLTRTVPGQATLTYGWDDANRLITLTQGAQTVSFGYDNANRRTSVVLPNGTVVSYQYDVAGQLTRATYVKGATTLGQLTYAYDNAGKLTGVGDSFARTLLPSVMTTASHNADNQLTQWGPSNLTYDLNGNLTSDGTFAYTWNARNQLIQIQQGASTIASYQYDAFGRRQQKVVNGTTTRFLYDGRNFVQERDAGGNVTANVLTGLAMDEVFARTKGANTSTFLLDHLGGIIAEADAAGVIQTSYSYEPFGRTMQTGVASDNSQRYTAREQDTADLYYNRARYYSAGLGRFISEDPIGVRGGLNVYRYADDDPIDYSDPTGLRPVGTCDPNPSRPCFIYPPGMRGLPKPGKCWQADGSNSCCKTSPDDCFWKCFAYFNPLQVHLVGGGIGGTGAIIFPHGSLLRLGCEAIAGVEGAWIGGTAVGCAINCSTDPCMFDGRAPFGPFGHH